ncbi:geranylgeranyl reductase family protein [Streptomyces tubbatahanensis]|uniref:Geranylgeranyl reductase family protein n=1 Tax=Streptomyces tubbatahanensis TaxID=2923272 RepID=A0ABY3Y0Z8_9ACTN|nr:geranylgeranyl reductase family protein [Streptomyces tubbatahanensis]UNT00501.1 geranylgeranyl reductase family protein [Streptomyces tubbatahanensis]
MSRPAAEQAQVIVVGAGPGGSTAAWHLARQGLSVALVEKSEFPREKVCGDGLTPRAVRQLVRMGIDTSAPGWMRNRGLRFVSRGRTLELDWPESSAFPAYGLTRTREDFDQLLARHAEAAGARLHTRTKVTAPLLDRAGRVVGVTTTGPEGRERDFTAPLVIAADGVAGRLAVSLGIERLKKRPVGTAVRRYFRSQAKHLDPYLESWLDLRREDGRILPGYSWIFPLGDGRVNVGLGVLNDSRTGSMQTRRLLETWLARTPAAWGLREDGNADGPLRGAALPMGFNRLPHYRDGLVLIGDAGGMVNPCNGEGITYAMESAELAADVAGQALARPAGPARERALEHYPAQMAHRLGRYYRLGRGFSALMARPAFTSLVTQNAVRSPAAMRFMVRLLSNLTDRPGTDAMDHLVNALIRVTPSPADHAGRFAGAPSLRRSRSRVPG